MTARPRASALLGVALAALAAAPALAQDHVHGHAGATAEAPAAHAHPAGGAPRPLGLPPSRDGSGTSWLPDASPMHMLHARRGGWTLGLMGNVFAQWIDEGGPRGEEQLGSVNWLMGMAEHGLAGGALRARAMLSAEPLTVGRCGYPDLLASGELCHGAPLHDRQHPHDLLMELSAAWQRELGRGVALELYGAPAGEPALGPTAFPHRPSAMPSPIAPIGHHWLDSTHVSFGVATAGLYGRAWKVEGSAFNGREPDEHRFDLDLAALDSFSARATLAPAARWTVQASAARLEAAEQVPGEGRADVERVTASAALALPLASRGGLDATAGWGLNSEHGHATSALLLESALSLRGHVLFARAEAAQKADEDLAVPGAAGAERWVGKLALAYVREAELRVGAGGVLLGLGVGGSLAAVPAPLRDAYGGRLALGLALFASARPAAMPR